MAMTLDSVKEGFFRFYFNLKIPLNLRVIFTLGFFIPKLFQGIRKPEQILYQFFRRRCRPLIRGVTACIHVVGDVGDGERGGDARHLKFCQERAESYGSATATPTSWNILRYWKEYSIYHMPLSIHWNENVVIFMKYSPLAALEVVKMIASIAASDENLIKMMIFRFSVSYMH